MRPHSLPLLLCLASCAVDSAPGPDLGACAVVPASGAYTYGEIGIGTCLSGPADLQFFEQDGHTWLAVANADPFVSFSSGSLLLIDFDSIDLDKGFNTLDELTAAALPTDRYVGGLGYLADSQTMLLTSRYSPDAPTRAGLDNVLVIDVSDPLQPVFPAEGSLVPVRDDPQPIVVDAADDRAYVLNLTDHSVSVLDTNAIPPVAIDVAPEATVSRGRFFDDDGDGSRAELSSSTIHDPNEVRTDKWTLTWIEGTYRLWLPQDGGLSRWESGGQVFVPAATGVDLHPDDAGALALADPFAFLLEGTTALLYEDDGLIRLAATNGTASAWRYDATAFLGGVSGSWAARIGSPSFLSAQTETIVYFDGRTAQGEPASIGLATTTDGGSWTLSSQPLFALPDAATSYEDPFVRYDPLVGRYRMWLSIWDGSQWSMGLSESADARAWSEPEVVLQLDAADVGAPAVTWSGGRYIAFVAMGGPGAWSHGRTFSYDGVHWSEPELVVDIDEGELGDAPPRAALQVDVTGGWRVEARDLGRLSTIAYPGLSYAVPADGLSFRTATGYEVGIGQLDGADNGVAPSSYLDIDGTPSLFVTLRGSDGLRRAGLLRRSGSSWLQVSQDLIAASTLGAVEVHEPVVYRAADNSLQLLVAATNADGLTRIVRATSPDGVAWTLADDDVVDAADPFDDDARVPGSVERDGSTWRLWYAGSDGNRFRIASAVSTNGVDFTPEPGPTDAWQLGTGQLGEFDDSTVRDPVAVRDGSVLTLLYSAWDGEKWSIGARRRTGTGAWSRPTNPSKLPIPRLSALSGTFSHGGVRRPVRMDDGFAYAGLDGTVGFEGGKARVGLAIGDADGLWATQRHPTTGDVLEFSTSAGTLGTSVIELEQSIDGFAALTGVSRPLGWGGTALVLDSERGFLYVTSKLFNYIYVLDVRDDSAGGYVDSNYLDIEAIILTESLAGTVGFRDAMPVGDRLYVTSASPDAVLVLDLTKVIDDDRKDVVAAASIAALPLRRWEEDAGSRSQAQNYAGGGMALVDDVLLVTHFRDNSLYAFDLDMGFVGTEIARIPYLGENPHVVRVSPDGRYAVVANYLGDTTGNAAQSTLAVVDVDPTSPRYLEVLTWLGNR